MASLFGFLTFFFLLSGLLLSKPVLDPRCALDLFCLVVNLDYNDVLFVRSGFARVMLVVLVPSRFGKLLILLFSEC